MVPPVPIDASRPVRWGIASTGRIASDFTRGLALLPDAEVLAVGSRTQEGADRFAFEHEIPHRHGSYESLANDNDVDVVYRTAHTPDLRRRREWVQKLDVDVVCWWVPAGHVPTVDEAMARLEQLRNEGPSDDAFLLRDVRAVPATT